jgi:hypothetical protein
VSTGSALLHSGCVVRAGNSCEGGKRLVGAALIVHHSAVCTTLVMYGYLFAAAASVIAYLVGMQYCR